MLLRLDGGGPLYQRIYGALRSMILDGRFHPGSRLPSTRTLARDLGVSRNTVLLAYQQLLADGYATGRLGSGTDVPSELPDASVLTKSLGKGAVNVPVLPPPRLSALGQRLADHAPLLPPEARRPRALIRYNFRYGLPAFDEFPHKIWRRLLARRARQASSASLSYGAAEGYPPLRENISDYLRRSRGVDCNPAQIVIVNGSQQALDLVARVLLDPGDRVVLEEPHYQGAREVFVAAGARLTAVPVDSQGLDVVTVRRVARAVRLAYVTPSHQFPTGAIMPPSRRLALLRWAEETGAYIVEDDYDSEYRYERRPVGAIQALDRAGRVIYLGTFSKVLFPALRLGYLVLPERLIGALRMAKWITDRHTATLHQEVLADFINEGHFERHLRRSRATLAARRQALLEALSKHLGDRVEVSGANAGAHLLIWLRDIKPSKLDALIDRAAKAGVAVYSVAPYYLTPPQRAGLLLGYASLKEPEIQAGIEILASILG